MDAPRERLTGRLIFGVSKGRIWRLQRLEYSTSFIVSPLRDSLRLASESACLKASYRGLSASDRCRSWTPNISENIRAPPSTDSGCCSVPYIRFHRAFDASNSPQVARSDNAQ